MEKRPMTFKKAPKEEKPVTATSQELVPQDNDIFDPIEAPALAPGVFTDAPDLDASDIEWARLSLVQPQADILTDPESKIRAGTFLIKGDVEGSRKVTIVPLKMHLSRRYATGPFGSEVVHCQSNDAKTGVGDPGGDCKTCPMAQWIEDPDPKRAGKRLLRCSPSYHYIAYSVEANQLVAVSFSKTATSAAKDINGRVATFGLGKFMVELTATKGKGDGNYFVPVPRFPRPSPEVLDDARLSLPPST
jgi:hypothetical protein